jgi:hypothetical protein
MSYIFRMAFYRNTEPGAVDPAITDEHLEAAFNDPAAFMERINPGFAVPVFRLFGWAPPFQGATVQTAVTASWSIERVLLRVVYTEEEGDIFVSSAREASMEELADYG